MGMEPNVIKAGSLAQPDSTGTPVTAVESTIAYAQGHLLFLRGSTLMAQPFDPGSLKPTGEAAPIAERIPVYMNPSRLAGFTVSAGGLLVYHGASSAGDRARLGWVDRQGKQVSIVGEPVRDFQSLELSPDQKSLLGGVFSGAGRTELWVWDLARGLKQRFTFDGNNPEGVWSPDGATIVWRSLNLSKGTLFRRPSNGTGTAEKLYADASAAANWPTSWSPDGKTLLFHNVDVDPKTRSDIFALPIEPAQQGELKPRVFLQTPFVERHAKFSPDGKWVAYVSDESSQPEVYVLPYPGPGGKRQVSVGGGWFPRWRRDGRELFFASRDGVLMAAEVSVRNGSFEVGPVKRLFAGLNTQRGYLYDVSADGQKVIVPMQGGGDNEGGAPATPPLTLVENWPALIKK
jgi:Tol biopolymer transport system component